MANDLFVDAEVVTIPTDGATYTSAVVDNTSYTRETGEPGIRLRTAWWAYTPATTGTATLDTQLSTSAGAGTDTYLTVYTGVALNSLTQVAVDDDSGGGATSLISGMPVTAGTTYYIQVASYGDYGINLVLRVTGPAHMSMPTVVTPADAEVSGAVFLQVAYSIPPADSTAETDISSLYVLFDASPAEVGVWAGGPIVQRFRTRMDSPAEGAIVPVARPLFRSRITHYEGKLREQLGVDVQVSTSSTFASIVTTVGTVVSPNLATVTRVVLPSDVDLPVDVPLYWRMRLVVDGSAHDWSQGKSFTVDPSNAGSHTIPLYWTVVDGEPWPHLWSVDPAAGSIGTETTIVGQGFPAEDDGTITVADVPLIISSWRRVPATAAAYTADRQINTTTIDAEHDEVIAIIPEGIPAPGGPLLVEGPDS